MNAASALREPDVSAPGDDAMLEGLQRSAFDYFVCHVNTDNGLVADTSRPGSHSSIAVVGFALSAYRSGLSAAG